ncbi:hypothetical protein [Halogeometricum luteum]|uniref:PH domain-containing protein n=1 Tax=Halogeometricum luteum TaxID=2950537 RepID=A0ABU2G4Z1_9EURY|nr:hypothetical protein [Halogeometricum sp. S3BR5-2]MDS0295859.1 hypothetical protein [Halogeometricum sp. S3BR5-2]
MSRPPKFALGLAAFAAGTVVAPVVAALFLVGAGSIAVATAVVGGSLVAGGAGYALGTDDAAARLGASRVGPVLLWIPAVFAVSTVTLVELDVPGRVVFVALAGVVVGCVGSAAAWTVAATERAERATAGRTPATTWEARPRRRWWHDEQTVGTLAVAAFVAYFALSFTVLPDSSSLQMAFTAALSGLFGLELQKNRRRTFRAYDRGVAVESGKTTTFYEWDRIRGVERVEGGLILRRRWGPLTDLDARADDVTDPDGLVRTLRGLREFPQ